MGLQIHGYRTGTDGLLDLQRPVAFPAKFVSGLELGEPAIGKCAAHDFARFHAVWGGRHGWCAERQSRASAMLLSTTIFATIIEMNHNCQVKSWVQIQTFTYHTLTKP